MGFLEEVVMNSPTYEEILAQARLLSLEDQLRLIEEIIADLRQRIEARQIPDEQKARRSILEFEGMDTESWKGVNVQGYINQERDSWDE